MALRQQLPTAPFQLRNPYRLDRPPFDPTEVLLALNAEEEAEETSRLQQQQQQQQQARPLPPQPAAGTKQPTKDEPGSKKSKDLAKKSKGLTKHPSDEALPGYAQTLENNSTQYSQLPSSFTQSWFGGRLSTRSGGPTGHPKQVSQPQQPPMQQPQQPQQQQSPERRSPPVPTITISHHIDTHTELTFERHVEWLTQTALWWDMPVIHLYPAPEPGPSLDYVEKVASKFSSWVNFLKIPAGEGYHLGPAAPTRSSGTGGKVKGARAIKSSVKKSLAQSGSLVDLESCAEGGMVTGHGRKGANSSSSMSLPLSAQKLLGGSGATGGAVPGPPEPIVGYVFVGSADEQAQYNQVFETMTRIYPLIEIRYINSFEPIHLQSRQQQELREEPCLHSLSWIHYWSAAKESQVLQSKIVNEVVRVRPMWTNNDHLHRNYVPPLPLPTIVAPLSPDSDLLDGHSLSFSETGLAISSPTNASVYLGNSSESDQLMQNSLRGLPSTVSISSLSSLDMDAFMDDDELGPREKLDLTSDAMTSRAESNNVRATTGTNPFHSPSQQDDQQQQQQQHRQQSQSSPPPPQQQQQQQTSRSHSLKLPLPSQTAQQHRQHHKRLGLNRAQSSFDIRDDILQEIICRAMGDDRRHRRWSGGHHHHHHLHHHGSERKGAGGYRRSVSTPLLTLPSHNQTHPSQQQQQQQQSPSVRRTKDRPLRSMSQGSLRSGDDEGNELSPPSSPTLRSVSVAASSSPSLSSSATTSSSISSPSTSSASSSSSSGLGHRLAGLAQRLGVYKMRGSPIMVDL